MWLYGNLSEFDPKIEEGRLHSFTNHWELDFLDTVRPLVGMQGMLFTHSLLSPAALHLSPSELWNLKCHTTSLPPGVAFSCLLSSTQNCLDTFPYYCYSPVVHSPWSTSLEATIPATTSVCSSFFSSTSFLVATSFSNSPNPPANRPSVKRWQERHNDQSVILTMVCHNNETWWPEN